MKRNPLAIRWRRMRQRGEKIRQGASLRLLVDADEYLSAMLEALECAERQIVVENYMIASDATGKQIVDLLCRKAQEGVKVWAVFDAVGSSRLSHADRKRMCEAGVFLRIFHPLRLLSFAKTFWRTHRRILVVDDFVGYVGGYGFSDEWTDRSSYGKYHERVWELRGLVLHDLLRSFRWGLGHLSGPTPEVFPIAEAPDNLAYRVFNLTHFRGTSALRVALRELASLARSRLWIATGYFVPTLFFRRALMRAASRGIDVRLYLTGPTTDHPIVRYAARRRYGALLEAGVKIFESVDRPMHAKCFVVDDTYANVGSANLDRWSIHFNRELNVEVFDRKSNHQLAQSLLELEADCEQIRLDTWSSRSVAGRTLEFFAGIFESLL